MKKNIQMFYLIFVMFFIIAGCSNNNNEQKRERFHNTSNETPKSSNFSDYFYFEKSILLDSNIVLNQIWTLDTDSTGNMLVTDLLGQHVVIFDEKGVLKNELNPERCTPGFNWVPIAAKYFPKAIIVLNSGPWGYLFNKDGNCYGEMSSSFVAPLHYTPFKHDKIIGYYGNGESLIKILDKKGDIINEFGELPIKYKNIVEGVAGGGVIVDDYDNIYISSVYSPEIIKYSSDGKAIDRFFRKPKNFNPIKDDLFKEGFYVGIAKIKDKTLTVSLNLINSSTIILELLNSSKTFSFEIISIDGQYLNSRTINSPGKILLAKYNKLYVLQNIDNVKVNEYVNPIINVYNFKL